jgi:hypothetical protein
MPASLAEVFHRRAIPSNDEFVSVVIAANKIVYPVAVASIRHWGYEYIHGAEVFTS